MVYHARVTGTDIEAHGVEHVGEKAEILAEVKKARKFFYGTVVAQAERIDLVCDTLVFAFEEPQQSLLAQLRHDRKWLEEVASRVSGRKIRVKTVVLGVGDGGVLPQGAWLHEPRGSEDDARATVMMPDGFIVDREVLQWIWDIESRGGSFIITETESGEMEGSVYAETDILTPGDEAFILAHISEVERIVTHKGKILDVC